MTKTSFCENPVWVDPVDMSRVSGSYRLKNLNPKLPADGVSLRGVVPPEHRQGRRESWEEAACRYESYARCEFGYDSPNPYSSVSEETRLFVGTLALPVRLLRGTHTQLFGEHSDTPSTWEIGAVAHALFYPLWGRNRWDDLCRRAEVEAKRRAAITAQVERLLALGE